MEILNKQTRYGMIAIFFHWVTAVLLFALLPLGIYMVRLPISLQKLKLYGWHKEYGIAALMLVCVRVIWRLANVAPLLPAYLSAFQKNAARCVHFALYICMFAMPITGWMISSAAGLSVSFFGLFVLPDFVLPNEKLQFFCERIHEYLGYGFIALISMHVFAAAFHYFFYKDNILRRMLP